MKRDGFATTLPFGGLEIGLTSLPRSVTVTSAGDLPLTPTAATLGGASPGDFTKSSDTCTGSFLSFGMSCSIGVRFKPVVAGTLSAALGIADNEAGSPRVVTLTGTGIPRFAGVRIAGGDLHLKKGKAGIRIRCPSATARACAGTLTLKTAKAVLTTPHGTPHVLKLGSARFTISSGKRPTVNVQISKAGRKLVHDKGHLNAIASAVSHDGFGVTKTTAARLRILPAK